MVIVPIVLTLFTYSLANKKNGVLCRLDRGYQQGAWEGLSFFENYARIYPVAVILIAVDEINYFQFFLDLFSDLINRTLYGFSGGQAW